MVKYRMPFTINGVDLIVGSPTPRCGPIPVMRYIQAIASELTFDALICVRLL